MEKTFPVPLETFFREVHKAGSDVKETLDKLSRKGCNYCLKTNPEYAGCSDIWHDNKLSIGYGNYIEINFCPMCGRYLRGANTPHHILPGVGKKYTERW